ncbi:ATP-grasp ribosomal peptide maturase [Kitasatospora sp. GP82]|uniref:ATP-grasp ribosomal peptide maturase n=1 Tax=Kitasatospora sp. GP82 TaxID=3035089 RepID=UPI0024770ECE|nr:ATP-grasp ribosomal peptide maturase [Kitasatospora sp. GP82]MDH6124944.1 ATP-grasp ribosomal peptide maturase [Kitasatospora sp. GP82]
MTGDRHGAVLVLTNPYDVTADVVLRILAERRVPAVRADPGVELHGGASLTSLYGSEGQRGILRTESRELDLNRVRSVWYRRPTAYAGPPGLGGQDAKFAAAQEFWGVGGILAALPGAHYVNHPWRVRDGEYKPAQLATAQQSGFLVPETVITTDPGEARAFCVDQTDGAVYKPIWNSAYRDDTGGAQQVWVREVDPDEITDAVAVCPHLFQARIPKAFDVRLTAVGRHLFAARIDGPELDWRRRQDRLTYAPIDVPVSVADAVADYCEAFGLVFGAFDFAVTPDGAWWFLECNPNGQWAWFPPEITTPVAHAIADQLERGPCA